VTDVFISYAREDRDRAHKLADALAAFGWSVWWDRKIITGEAFDQAIERELETAKSIVVLWSEHSIASDDCVRMGQERGSSRVGARRVGARSD
jgi:hypothetical protein